MELRRLFTEDSDGFDELDRFLLRAIADRAHGREPEESPYTRNVLFERAEQRSVTHLFFDTLFDETGTEAAGPSPFEAARTFARSALTENVRSWGEIARTFAAAGVRVAGFKGPFLNAVLGRPVERAPMSVDLDLLVGRDTLDQAVRLLESLGYVKGLGIKDHRFYRLGQHGIQDLEGEQGSYGQIAPMARLLSLPELDHWADRLPAWFPKRDLVPASAGVRSLTSIDLHFDLGHTDHGADHPVPVGELLDGAVTADYLGTELTTLDLPTMTWLLSYRAYLDSALFGERRFKLFADIAVTLRSGGWSDAVVAAAVDRYPFIRTPIEETLSFLRTELGVEPATSTSYAGTGDIPAAISP
ncbi:nucleotidyltransferase family protein [Streptomyces fulvoviolaceus]|uniref:nucleotidyltransferase family protein n=1 Tax=Streptomyces fulvoviolaceus TaxID=285535 RepID=UPI0021C1D01C|nr:nucleotidyltransferase family protein [Streptomyces fulvoviolaceus]MCT9076398.1 nucleotidyltransferase family protein [Streptomyces fulvoviolaceus]